MRADLLPLLRCPSCHAAGSGAIEEAARDEREVREGTLRCSACGLRRPLKAGVVDLLLEPPSYVRAEARGLERFAQAMRRDGWDRARVLNLPDERSGYWFTQRRSIDRLLDLIPFEAGQSILDIGSNTCWATAIFAELGLRAVALDIATVEMQGLHTADWWFEDRDVYFERVLSSMNALPFADASLDWVFCCEVLHHNDRTQLTRTLREIHRVLRPGGSLLVMNEPLRWPRQLKRDHGADVAEFAGNEHIYFLIEYLWMARRAGFRDIQVTEPAFDHFFSRYPLHLVEEASVLGSFKLAALNVARMHRFSRRAYLLWRYLMGPLVSLQMVCRKASEQETRQAGRGGGIRLAVYGDPAFKGR